MQAICRLLGHQSPDMGTWNNGYYFARCTRCESEVIRRGSERRWQDVPRGYRVAWKPMGEFDIRW